MTRHIIGAVCAAWVLSAPVQGSADPVVVELFTSQGCSSCPPADDMLASLAEREDVIALSLHVDYWDYIGWEDSFGRHGFTQRQKAYARQAGRSSIYTPQMIIGGQTDVVGSDAMAVMDAILAQKGAVSPVQLTLTRNGSSLHIDLASSEPLELPAQIEVVRYLPRSQVEITRGENAGMTIEYVNVVTGWDTIGTWDGRAPATLKTELVAADEPIVVLLQEEGYRRILAAARAR